MNYTCIQIFHDLLSFKIFQKVFLITSTRFSLSKCLTLSTHTACIQPLYYDHVCLKQSYCDFYTIFGYSEVFVLEI